MKSSIDHTGKRLGDYKVLEDVGLAAGGYRLWLCRCDQCGHSRNVSSHMLCASQIGRYSMRCKNCKRIRREEVKKARAEERLAQYGVSAFGKTMTVVGWAKEMGVTRARVYQLLARTDSPEDVLWTKGGAPKNEMSRKHRKLYLAAKKAGRP